MRWWADVADFVMPSLGADMEEGTVLQWLVKPGDVVHRGDVVAVVDTDKAAVDVEVFSDGVVEELLVPEGTRVPVGTPLARLAPGGAAVATAPTPAAAPAPAASAPAAPAPATSPLVRKDARSHGVDLARVHGSGPGGRVRRADVGRPTRPPVSPYARRLAREQGVDLASVRGTGPGGAVRADDVRAAATVAPAPAPRAASPMRVSPMRETIARAMTRSWREVPHYHLASTIDLHPAVTWLRQINLDRPVSDRVVPAALLLKATALALRDVPELNGFWADDAFAGSPTVHLGVAVSLRGGGLVAPALLDADQLPLADLMRGLRDLVERARRGRLRREELESATATVTNLGDLGVEVVHGVVYAPQVALVGFGRVVERPWAVDGMVGVRPVVTATLAADHRATDGFTGARFLAAVEKYLQRPEGL